MTKQYNGYLVDVKTKERGDLWTAEVWIWPALGLPGTKFDDWQLEGWDLRERAEAAAWRLAEQRIDQWIAFEARDK